MIELNHSVHLYFASLHLNYAISFRKLRNIKIFPMRHECARIHFSRNAISNMGIPWTPWLLLWFSVPENMCQNRKISCSTRWKQLPSVTCQDIVDDSTRQQYSPPQQLRENRKLERL